MTYRFYYCGCEPDFDRYCEAADQRVWEARDATASWALDDWMGAEEDERLEKKISDADRWVGAHFKVQNESGAYRDVEEKELEPPDDGYDEGGV